MSINCLNVTYVRATVMKVYTICYFSTNPSCSQYFPVWLATYLFSYGKIILKTQLIMLHPRKN